MTTRSLCRAAFLAALAIPAAASAARFHLALKSAQPAIDGTVSTPPRELRLWFTQRPELAVTTVKLLHADGRAVTAGALSRADSAGAPIVVPVEEALTPGAYRVEWRTMARDGHVQRGAYGFTLKTATHP